MNLSRREALNNIIRFKRHVLELKKNQPGKSQRAYSAILNRKTGDIRFSAKIAQESKADWGEIQIEVQLTPEHRVYFEIWNEKHQHVHSREVEKVAYHVLKETVETLNQLAVLYSWPKSLAAYPEEIVLQDLSNVHVMTNLEKIEDQPGWVGRFDRFQAEKVLQEEPVGTYLLREEVNSTLTATLQKLKKANKIWVNGYLCTVHSLGHIISEFLIIQTEKGWAVYQDNPILLDYSYTDSLQTLLDSLPYPLKRPFHFVT